MNRLASLLSVCALAAMGCNERAVQRPVPEAGATGSEQCLSIVAWNDMHGTLAPDDALVDTGRVAVGGVVAVADQVADIRATGDAVVVLDAGDLFTGPLESTLAEGAPIIDAYRVIGVDAAAVGNHEFDFGPVGYSTVVAPPGTTDAAGEQGPRGALLARMASASFPFLSANVHRADGAALAWPNFAPSTRIERDGWSVGVVGYTTRETPTTTLKPNVADLEFVKGAAESVAKEIRALRASGSHPVVLVAHASLEGDLPQSLDDPGDPHGEKRKGEMAALLAGLGDDLPDLVIAGHRHAWLLGRVRNVPIVSSDQHGVGVSRSRFCRAAPGEKATLATIERRVAMANTPPTSKLGEQVQAAIAPWQAKVKGEADTIVTKLATTCLAQGSNGTAFAEQVARAVRDHVADAAPAPKGVPVVALVNSGGLRAPLLPGSLRFADLFCAFPFENAVAACGTDRDGLKRVIENAIKRPSARERFPFGIAGARVTLTRALDGSLTLDSIFIEGDAALKQPKDTRVWLAIPDFVLWGGDGLLDGVTCEPGVSSPTRVRDAWRALLEREQGGCAGPPHNITITSP
jgi:5'-nucleotidase